MATILIVEDRAIDRTLLATLLRAHGHTVHEAADGADALAQLEHLQPALVISDLLMPTLDGFEFVRRMRDMPHLEHTPVMFYTASYHEREALELARKTGVADVLTKPADSSVILSRVDRWLNAGADERHFSPDPVALARENALLYEKARAHADALEAEVAEHRRTESLLRATQERIEFALSSAGIGVWDCDVVRDRVTWSRSMWSVVGRDPAAPAPKNMAEFYGLIHADDFERVRTMARQAIAAHKDLQLEYRVKGDDGLIRTIDTRARVVYGDDGGPRAIHGVNLDITERRSLEDQLRQAQKMEALGQLAGGIAHDFNNMLTAILGYAQFIAEAPELPAELREDLDLIVESGRRASALTRQLLAFSRKQVLQPVALDLNDLVRRTSPILQRLIGEHISLTMRLDDRLGPALADPHQVEQILLNLSVNARDAMPDGGDLILETANVVLDESYASSHPDVKPGAYAMLAVSDTGIGMDADTRARLFDPFFTTKPVGVGTGLGLSTVYGIVQQSGGSIGVHSEPEQGATFKVYLPQSVEDAAADLPDRPIEPPPGGRESVLVVEDERAVRLLMGATLRRAGYTVFEADAPATAEQLFLSHGDQIALLITDVVMPGMNGPSLYARLHARSPALKVIYASGYTDGSIGHNGRLESDVAFLQKPFSGDALMRKVREVLDS